MPEVTRQFGNLTIHFLGDSAQQLASTFDSAYGRSGRFQSEIGDAVRTFRDFYVGRSLDDLSRSPGYEGLDWSGVREGATGFGQLGGPDSYFSVVTGADHELLHEGHRFPGTTELSVVHELLHPMQEMRDLAAGIGYNEGSETSVQMREQTIAEELGYQIGRTFPDVVGTGARYQVVPPQRDTDTHPNNGSGFAPPQPNAPDRDRLFGLLQLNPADASTAIPAALSQLQMVPQQVLAPTPQVHDLLLDGTTQLLPFFLAQALKPDSTWALPATSPADGIAPGSLSSPSGQFGGAAMPGAPFGALGTSSGARSAGRTQTQVTPQQVSAPTPSMEDLIPEALKPLVPHLFPDGFNPDWSPASPPAGADASAVPSQTTSRQASAPDPAVVDLLPPELRILVPFFFPQGFGNG